jgi:ribosomal protein S6--L-glutamate ligase
MRLAILASPDSWYYHDLRRAAGRSHQLDQFAFADIASQSSRDGAWCITAGGRDLAEYDAVLVRTMPPGSLEQIVFRMDALGRLQSQGVAIFNPPRSLEAAVDKYLGSAKLAEAGLPTPRTVVCQTVDDAMTAFDVLGGDVVVKPLFGAEGRGMMRVEDESIAIRAFKSLVQLNAVLYLQQFIAHEGVDIRLLVVGRDVLAMRRRNSGDWRTNVSRGAIPEPMVPDAPLVSLALRAATALGTSIAGVDVLKSTSGETYVLEVNAVPGWKALAETLECDIAARVLHHVEESLSNR